MIRRVATGVGALVGVALLVIGGRFLLDPGGAATGFGVPAPSGDAYLTVKGERDVGIGLILLTLAAVGQHRALGWALLVGALMPWGDMVIVLAHGGPPVTAFAIHGATAVVTMAAGATLVWVTRTAEQRSTDPAAFPNATPSAPAAVPTRPRRAR